MPVIQMDSSLLAGLAAGGQVAQQGFADNQLRQQLQLAQLKQQQDNAVAQGHLQNESQLVDPQIAQMQALVAKYNADTAGQNLTNRTIIPQSQADIGVKKATAANLGAQTNKTNTETQWVGPEAQSRINMQGSMAHLYGLQGQHDQAEINTLIPAQAAQLQAGATRDTALASQADAQTAIMKKIGIMGKSINANNAMQVIDADPYAQRVYQQMLTQDPALVMQSPAWQSLSSFSQSAISALMNAPGIRRNVITANDMQHNAGTESVKFVNTLLPVDPTNPTAAGSVLNNVAGGQAGMLRLMLSNAVRQMILDHGASGWAPQTDTITKFLQLVAGGAKGQTYGMTPDAANKILSSMQLQATVPGSP